MELPLASLKYILIAKMPDGFDATARPWYKQALEHKGEVIITPTI